MVGYLYRHRQTYPTGKEINTNYEYKKYKDEKK